MIDADQNITFFTDAISQWLRDHYGLAGQLERLPGESDLNVKLTADDGNAYVCKFSDSACDRDLLSAQSEVLRVLNERKLTAIPRVLKSRSGDPLVAFEANGQASVGRVLTFVEGSVLTKCAPYSAALLRNLGRTMGQLNRALVDYDNPAFHYTFDWDLAQGMDVVERYSHLIADADVREGVAQIARNFETIVVPFFGPLRQSVIHNDANDYNVLSQGDDITGLIDFGDMIYSYTVCDLAIAMAYAALGVNDVLQVVDEMAYGFNEYMPLDQHERAVLFPMMCMRLAVSASIAAHQMRLRPDDPYLVISQAPIRKALPTLLALDVNAVHQRLKDTLS